MHVNKILFLAMILTVQCLAVESRAQFVPYLEQKVTIQSNNKLPAEILKSIEQQSDFTFSYDQRIIDGIKPQSINVKDKSIRSILDEIFDGKVKYKEKGKHIILTAAPEAKSSDENSYFIISGYIKDGQNGNNIPEASIVDKNSRESAVSNKYGYFNLHVTNKQKSELLNLSIYKANYKDTVVIIKQTGNTVLNLTIFPEESSSVVDSSAIRDSLMTVDQLAFINMLLSEEAKSNTKNVDDTLHSKFQISFLPFLGTNLKLSGNTVNDYSLNVLAGYSMGTRVVEVGGLVNINRDSVKSVQVAGWSNVTGGPVSGVQVAGLVNLNMKTTNGVQISGLINANMKKTKGVQVAGLINNDIDTSNAVQVAGLINVNLKKSTEPHIAGLVNVSVENASGAHIAGLLNVATKRFNGVQISGLVNYATKINGSQIGFLNIADSCSGIPVGFMSLVRNGYHELEISSDETFPVSASFRTGVKPFYNIFTAGIKKLDEPDNTWYFGYGIGSTVRLGKSWDMNFDLTMSQVMAGNRIEFFNPLTRFNLGVEKRFSKYFAIAAGPTLNYYHVNTTDPDYADVYSKIPPEKVIDTKRYDDYKGTMWVGGKIAVRFF